MRIAIVLMGALVLAGCSETKKLELQPVTIKGSDFCDIVDRKLDWDLQDTRKTIDGVRRLNAKWDSKCGKDKPEPTS